jgi:ABC-type Fe3+-siderophore transport system, permease component
MLVAKNWALVQASAVAFGFAAVIAAVGIAEVYRKKTILMLVLGGIISEALFTSLISVIKFAADPTDQLPVIIYWLMGNLSFADRVTMLTVSGPMIAGILVLFLFGGHLNVLSMGEEEARTLGVNVKRTRYIVIFLTTMISSLTVMLGGIVGWVGLVIPHAARSMVGPDNRILLPASALLGGIYLLLMDNLSRLLFSFEIPIGIITSIIGIPCFVVILKNARKGWG